MKIRNGFVSNSSSSSFFIKQADKHLPLEEISEYYKINPELPEEERVWLTFLIWKILSDQEKYDADTTRDKDIWRSPRNSRASNGLDYYLSDDHINWAQSNSCTREDPEYWENAKKLLDDPKKILHFDLSTDTYDNDLDDMGISMPFDAIYGLRQHAEEAFLDTSKALGISE